MKITWKTYLMISLLYVNIFIPIALIRFQNIPKYLDENRNYKHYTDYKTTTALSAVIAKGVWPWDNTAYLYRGIPCVPIYNMYMFGYTTLCGLIINLGLVPEYVVYVLTPLLTIILLPIIIYLSGKILSLTPKKTTLFFIMVALISDYAFIRFISPKGETFGFYLSILGMAYYKTKKYISSGIIYGLSIYFNFINLVNVTILMGGFALFFIINYLKTRNLNMKPSITFFVVYIMFMPILTPYIKVTTTKWTPRDYEGLEEGVVPPQVIKPDVYTSNLTEAPINAIMDLDLRPPSPSILIPTKLDQFITTFFYPVSYVYWGYPGRSSIAHVCRLFNYTLTSKIEDEIKHFKINLKNIFPTITGALYTIIFPLVFFSVWWNHLKNNDFEEIYYSIMAYLLPIFIAFLHLLTGISIVARRVIPFVEIFFIIQLITKEKDDKYDKYFLILSIIMFIRFSLWYTSRILYGVGP